MIRILCWPALAAMVAVRVGAVVRMRLMAKAMASEINFSGSIVPLRVIQHYSDWVCTAVMSHYNVVLPLVA